MGAGNVAASYYLGPMLNNAGITDQTTQLQIVSAPVARIDGPLIFRTSSSTPFASSAR
jgi:hypothetical protein